MARSNTTWDPVRARLASAAGVEARKRNRAYRLAHPPALPPKDPVNPVAQAQTQPGPAITFVERRLARVREQLDRLDELFKAATEPKAIKELADATTRLQAQEQQLAGRPGPGTLKPSAPGATRPAAYAPAVPLPPQEPSPAKQGEVRRASPPIAPAQAPEPEDDPPLEYGPVD
jgi:TolA-binding protein